MLKSLYKKIWVPMMGRILAVLIPLIEGQEPNEIPTYDIDGDQRTKKNK